MINGNFYDPKNLWHPYLGFVGCIDPLLCKKTCGSVFLVHQEYIVTAAHCLDNCSKWNIVFPQGQERSIVDTSRIVKHDIAWCRLNKPITDIKPVTISTENIRLYQKVVLAGWGKNEDLNQPFSRLHWGASRVTRILKNKRLCIEKGKDTLSARTGDSGSPILVRKKDCLYAAGIVCNTNVCHRELWHFNQYIPQGPPHQIDKKVFDRIVNLDFERRAIRKVFLSSDASDWRSIDKWLSEQTSENQMK